MRTNHATEVLAAAAPFCDLGTKHFRVKCAGYPTTYPALIDAWREIVIIKAQHRRWPPDLSQAKIARLSLERIEAAEGMPSP